MAAAAVGVLVWPFWIVEGLSRERHGGPWYGRPPTAGSLTFVAPPAHRLPHPRRPSAQTTTNNITNIAREVTALGGAVPISCTKERVGTGARIRLNPALSILDVLGPWRVDGGTSAVSCAGATGVYLTTDRSRPVILEFLTPGEAAGRYSVRVLSDWTAGLRQLAPVVRVSGCQCVSSPNGYHAQDHEPPERPKLPLVSVGAQPPR